jgi:hypothetical protein
MRRGKLSAPFSPRRFAIQGEDMKANTVKFLVAALVLLLGVVFSASAMPTGRQVPMTQELQQFFTDHGIDPQYVDKAQDMVPPDQWTKIVSLSKDPALLNLVQDNLKTYISAMGNDVYLRVGPTYYEFSRTNGYDPTFSISSAS